MRKSLINSLFPAEVRQILDRTFLGQVAPSDPEGQEDLAKAFKSWKIDPRFEYAGLTALDAALAQIVLGHIELHLPDFTVMAHGSLSHARPAFRTPALSSDMLFKPIRLFMIDWALSAPGLSWPEVYHATWLPGYDVFVVTLSQDTDEVLGVADLAIGWFSDRNIFDLACRRVVTRYWKRLAAENGQQEWEAFVSAGRMDEPAVRKWARRVRWAASF